MSGVNGSIQKKGAQNVSVKEESWYKTSETKRLLSRS